MSTIGAVAVRQHRYSALRPGPRLLVLGAVHGNETCGTQAIMRVIAMLDAGQLQLERGVLTLVPIANPLAYQRGQRAGDRNLNRNLRPNPTPFDFEDHVANVLCPLLAEHEVLLDLHSFTAPAAPFVMVGTADPTSLEWQFARALGPQRFVTGWMEVYEAGVVRRRQAKKIFDDPGLLDTQYGVGTTEYMRSCGGYGVTLECGQHAQPAAIDVAQRAILNALAFLGLVDSASCPPSLTDDNLELLRLTEVVDREHESDTLAADWTSFSKQKKGDLVATRHDGQPILAPADGCIMFPSRFASVGHEWFYFAQRET